MVVDTKNISKYWDFPTNKSSSQLLEVTLGSIVFVVSSGNCLNVDPKNSLEIWEKCQVEALCHSLAVLAPWLNNLALASNSVWLFVNEMRFDQGNFISDSFFWHPSAFAVVFC